MTRALVAVGAGLTALATFTATAVLALVLALALGACAPAAEPYPVIAAAELAPLTEDITGPIEILGSNEDGGDMTDAALRTLAAYHVHLPDAAPRHAVIYSAASCDAGDDRPFAFADLETIRRVGDETHFFADGILIQGHRTELDTQTVQAELSLQPGTDFYVLGKIAVVQAPDVDGAPGAWLACGVFTAVDRCVGCDRP